VFALNPAFLGSERGNRVAYLLWLEPLVLRDSQGRTQVARPCESVVL